MTHRVHELKILPEYFTAILEGFKTFEIRQADRDYRVGDILHLKEYDASQTLTYTGRDLYVAVTYILSDYAYVKEGYIVMSIKLTEL